MVRSRYSRRLRLSWLQGTFRRSPVASFLKTILLRRGGSRCAKPASISAGRARLRRLSFLCQSVGDFRADFDGEAGVAVPDDQNSVPPFLFGFRSGLACWVIEFVLECGDWVATISAIRSVVGSHFVSCLLGPDP